jgi:purine-binding chemotaxis protein CheW
MKKKNKFKFFKISKKKKLESTPNASALTGDIPRNEVEKSVPTQAQDSSSKIGQQKNNGIDIKQGPETTEGIQLETSQAPEHSQDTMYADAIAKAKETQSNTDADTITEVISFLVGNKEFAINILNIIEIVIIEKIDPLINAQEYIDGLYNIRNEMIPVVNLNKKLKIEEKEKTHFGIISTIGDRKVCLLAKKIIEVIYLDKVKVFDLPLLISGINDYLYKVIKIESGSGERVISIINLKNLFSSEEKLVLNKVSNKEAI